MASAVEDGAGAAGVVGGGDRDEDALRDGDAGWDGVRATLARDRMGVVGASRLGEKTATRDAAEVGGSIISEATMAVR